jgi:hypothetical protein
MSRSHHGRDDTRRGYCLCGNEYPRPVAERAQAAAERIVRDKLGADPPLVCDWSVEFRAAKKPSDDVDAIREALLAGRAWISWLRDDRLADDMRLMHGPPASGEYGQQQGVRQPGATEPATPSSSATGRRAAR